MLIFIYSPCGTLNEDHLRSSAKYITTKEQVTTNAAIQPLTKLALYLGWIFIIIVLQQTKLKKKIFFLYCNYKMAG